MTILSGGPTPIPTEYQGILFRSRLEARWAVFFDDIGLDWEYEPEGFDLPTRRYLPDFRLTWIDKTYGNWGSKRSPQQLSKSLWFEVKPNDKFLDDEWKETFQWLVAQTEMDLIVAYSIPNCRMWWNESRMWFDTVYEERDHYLQWYHLSTDRVRISPARWNACCDCGFFDVMRWSGDENGWHNHAHSSPGQHFVVDQAFAAATKKRFW